MDRTARITVSSRWSTRQVGKDYVLVDAVSGAWLVVDDEARRLVEKLRGSTRGESELRTWLGEAFVESLLASGLAARGDGSGLLGEIPRWERPEKIFVVLHLTDECSFSCGYCYADSSKRGQGRYMGSEILDRVAGLLVDSHHTDVHLGLHGGEPFLWLRDRRGLLERFLDHLAAAGKQVRAHVQTSGALIHRDSLVFLKDRSIGVGVSCDGPGWLNDSYRKWISGRGTSRQIEACFHALDRLEIPFGVICSVGRYSVDYAEEIVRYFARRGVRQVRFNPVWGYPRARANGMAVTPEGYLQFYRRLLDVLYEHNANAPTSPVTSVDLGWILRNIRTREREFMCLRSPCGAGGIPMLAVGPEGDVYPCEKMVSLSEYRAGRVSDAESLSALLAAPVMDRVRRRTVEEIPQCRTCDWRAFCGGGCPADVAALGADLLRPDPHCAFYRNLFGELMVQLVEREDLVDRVCPPELRGRPAATTREEMPELEHAS